MGRLVSLTLVDASGEIVGTLAPFGVDIPWWSEVGSVVAGAAAEHGADVTVLRLLDVAAPAPAEGGAVRYLAELHGPARAALGPPDGRPLADDPRRLPWARPGGPAADVAWADGVLRQRHRPRTGPAAQLRTWNLSSIWRLPTASGDVWLKVVPAPLAHEGAVLDAVARSGTTVPPLLAADGCGRALLDDVPGTNQWGAPRDRLLAMVGVLLDLQAAWQGRADDAVGLGVRDWRATPFIAAVHDTMTTWAAGLPPEVRATVDRLVDGLETRFAALHACGLPDTLCHGDFHPGNFRSDGASLVLLDWGDSGYGHPALDLAGGFLDRAPADDREPLRQAWLDGWRGLAPGSDPDRALQLALPLASLCRAATYHRFLEAFEGSERVYHEADVPRWLRAAAGCA